MSNDEINKKYPKKKVALLMGYSGIGYSGMQHQNNDNSVKTIEAELFKAFDQSNAVRKENLENTNKMSFQRCSRTDKNVSAMRQVVSVRINMIPNIVDELNKYLPPNIRVFDVIKVTKSFNSKNMCSGRSYRYVLPSFVFTKMGIDKSARLTDDDIDYINSLFSRYIGTFNFANFTAKRDFNDKSCMRYITGFKLIETFTIDDTELVDIRVEGQSFMLHQIRKMIGFVICIIRGFFTEDDLNQVFKVRNSTIPLAPGFGLMLYKTHFDAYNKRCKKGPEINKPIECRPEIEDIIEKSIVEYELNEGATFSWLKMLKDVHFSDNSMES